MKAKIGPINMEKFLKTSKLENFPFFKYQLLVYFHNQNYFMHYISLL